MGTFTVISAQVLVPTYIPGGVISTSSSTCLGDYKDFTYGTAPILRVIKKGPGGGDGSKIVGTYTGNPMKFINITGISITHVPSGTVITDPIAKIYAYPSGTQITSFPYQLNVEGLTDPEAAIGIAIGYQNAPLCVTGQGFKVLMSFTITDVLGVTGISRDYILQSTYTGT